MGQNRGMGFSILQPLDRLTAHDKVLRNDFRGHYVEQV
jgi:hypothetical protein